MSKTYHIDINMKPAICRAVVKPCPRGGKHFSSFEEAEEYANQIAPLINSTKELSNKNFEKTIDDINELACRVYSISPTDTVGFDYESYMSASYAKYIGLNNALIKTEKGWRLAFKDESLSKEDFKQLIQTANKTLKDNYAIDKGASLSRAIYFNKNNLNKIFIQTGAPNLLDGAIVEEGNVKLLEIKKLHGGGAQMKSRAIATTNNGEFIVNDNDVEEEVKDEIAKHNLNTETSNYIKLNVSNQTALTHFVNDYKQKNGDELVFTNHEGLPLTVDMKRRTDIIVVEMVNLGFEGSLKIRTNLTTKKMDESSLFRFKENKQKLFTGEINEQDNSITLGQLNVGKFEKTGNYLRIGEFKTKIKWNDRFTSGKNTKIYLNELKYFSPVLSGDIKLKK